VDPEDGRADLRAGLVRAVSPEAFRQDAARLLRAYRLAAELGFSIEGETEAMIGRDHALISGVAAERVRDELCGVLAVTASAPWLRRLDGVGLLGVIIPELEATRGVVQPREHYWDVFDHSLETVAALERLVCSRPEGDEVLSMVPWSPRLAQHLQRETSGGRTRLVILKLAALLHDLGKPAMKHFDDDGRMRFIGHAREGAALAASVMQRLRFSSREVGLVERMVAFHMRPGQMASVGLPTPRAIYRYFRDAGEGGVDILFLGLADHLATRGPRLSLPEWKEHVGLVDYVLARYFDAQGAVVPPKLVDGHDVMRALGLSPGPRLGQLLEEVREAQAAGEVSTREGALAYLMERFGRERCAGEMRPS
jgi:poly(A) polymerase